MHFLNTPADKRVALRVENSVFNIDVAGKDLFMNNVTSIDEERKKFN